MPREEVRRHLITVHQLQANKYVPHSPTAKQLAFLMLDSEEAFYGGAAGGGKSDCLLMAALQYVDRPGYSALLFRRTYADLSLPGALMDRAREWLSGTNARWKDSEKTWLFPSGATLTFGYLETEQDKLRYQGSEIQFCGFDELTQFSETQYRYLFSRLRRLKTADVPIRMRAASNPGGIGHDWVKQRFIIEGKQHNRPFIPAKLADNPYLDQESYEKSLDKLDPVTRAQLKAGDWSARTAGSKFQREWFKVVEAAPADLRCVRYWDLAATEKTSTNDPDWTAGALLGVSNAKQYYLLDMRHIRGTDLAVENALIQTARLDTPATHIWIEQEPGASGVARANYLIRALAGFTVHADRPQASKLERASPVASQAEAGNLFVVRGTWLNAFLDEVESFPMGGHDDQVDALSGAFAWLSSTRKPFMVTA